MSSVSLAFIIAFLLLACVDLVSVVSWENSGSQERDHGDHDDDHHGFSTVVRRELMCDSSGRACTHKAVRALGKGKPDLQTPAESGPAGTAFKTGKTLGRDIVSNLSEGAANAGNAASEVRFATQLLDGLRFLVGLTGLVGYVTAYGMCVWVVFISNSACARAVPQWQLRAVERVVSGAYCRAMSRCISGAVVGHFLGLERSGKLEGYDLLASLVMVLANLLYLEPRATQALLEKMELEKKDGKLEGSLPLEPSGGRVGNNKTSEPPEPPSSADDHTTDDSTERDKRIIIKERMSRLNARIKTLNSCSSFLNVTILVSLTLHLVYIGYYLQLDTY